MEKKEGGYEARKLAYQDVLRAFDHFIETIPEGAPFILAGHSQGTEHGMRLIRERIYEKPLMERMVAAYLIGIPMSYEDLEKDLPGFEVCQDASQTGCLINYASFREDVEEFPFITESEWFDGENWRKNAGAPFVCLNPLSWQTNETKASADLHLGGVLEGEARPKTSARCQNSALLVEDLDEHMGWDLGGNYHVYDIGMFYSNIAQNAKERIDAYYKKKDLERFRETAVAHVGSESKLSLVGY